VGGSGHDLLSLHLAGGKPQKTLSLQSQSLGRDLILGPSEYEAVLLPTYVTFGHDLQEI
jgi:hypothetical protein